MGEVIAMPQVAQYCTFTVDGLYFGVHVHGVQEVLRHQPMTPVPLAPPAVRGLINLRGQIVTAIDLRLRLGRPARPADALPLNVVVRSHGDSVSLLVDDIGDVVDAGGLDLLPPPANLPPMIRELLQGVVALPGAILLVLDADRAVDLSDPILGGTP
jgi:purine-binding chemotaxis protein CheW